MINLLLLFFISWFSLPKAWAVDLCDVINIENCSGVSKQTRRSSTQSLPSVATAAQFNPANVSHDRGLGVETFYQPGGGASFNFVTGTGKAGAALVSTKIENSFFSNRIIELESDYFERREAQKQYESDKYTLALGAALWKNRKFGLDLGLLFKHNDDIKRVNPGGGLALRLGPLTLGATLYQDDVKLNPLNGVSYEERFTVQTYSGGLKIKNLFLDAGVIKTHYKFYQDDSIIRLYSVAYIWQKFLFNVALREEKSSAWKYKNDQPVPDEMVHDYYGGLQYSFNRRFILGAHYNYYLLNEVALSGTFFI